MLCDQHVPPRAGDIVHEFEARGLERTGRDHRGFVHGRGLGRLGGHGSAEVIGHIILTSAEWSRKGAVAVSGDAMRDSAFPSHYGMRRLILGILIVLVAACVVLAFQLDRRNPEHTVLTDQARREAANGAFVRLGDGVTHYDVAGPDTGARVLLVHGFSVPGYIWDSTMVALSGAGFRVARYDSYGRGYSDRPDVSYELGLYDRQILQLLDSLGWKEPVHLIGLSYGGPVIGTFVANHPERVRSLTFVDPAAGNVRSLPWYLRMPVVGPWLWQVMAVPTMADGQSSDFYEPAKWPGWADRYRPQQAFIGFGNALRRTILDNAGGNYDSLYAAVGRTQKPTLLLWGKEDQTVTIDKAEQVRRGVPQAEFHVIDRAGHLPHMERTDVVNPLLTVWLRGH